MPANGRQKAAVPPRPVVPGERRYRDGDGYDLSYIIGPRAGSRIVGRRSASAWAPRERQERPQLPPGGGYTPAPANGLRSTWSSKLPIGLPDDPARGLAPAARAAVPPRPIVPGERRYRDGDRVRHAAFGEGTVVSSKLTRDDEEVTVAFPERGVKKLLASLANLEIVG